MNKKIDMRNSPIHEDVEKLMQWLHLLFLFLLFLLPLFLLPLPFSSSSSLFILTLHPSIGPSSLAP
jgi:hypothetical protein